MKRPVGLWLIGLAGGLAVGAGLATLMFWRAPANAGPVVINETAVPPVPPLDPDQITRGTALYAQNCASCHGANLEGQPSWKVRLPDGSLPAPPHDDSGHTWHHADAQLMDIIARGGQAVYGSPVYVSKMPPFGDPLSEEELAAILEFFKSKWGEDQREYQWWMTATGAGQ